MVGNRDKRRNRPWLPPQHSTAHPSIWGGKDVEAGGCWMAVNAQGTMAALTNHNQAKVTLDARPKSRGLLVLNVLRQGSLAKGLTWLANQRILSYNPFHLILGNADELWRISSEAPTPTPLKAGQLWAMSNGSLHQAPLPKVVYAQTFGQQGAQLAPQGWWQALQQFLCQANPLVADAGHHAPPNAQVYVTGEGYGTVCSTLMAAGGALGTRFDFASAAQMDEARKTQQHSQHWKNPYYAALPRHFIQPA